MPEGPEVKIIADVLNEIIGDQEFIIENISVERTSKYYGKSSSLNLEAMIGKELGSVIPYGKKVIFTIVGSEFPVIVSSLGLEGHWILLDDYDKAKKYPHVSFIFTLKKKSILDPSLTDRSDDKPTQFLIYADSRHFGLLSIATDIKQYDFLMKDVGPSWLQDNVTFEQFYTVLRNKRFKADKIIVDFLVEQKYFSGIGNYMRSEILYLAKISPHRPLNTLSIEDSRRIYDAVFLVIEEALKANGHTLHSYFTPIGTIGGYEPIIYGRSKTGDSIHADVISEKDKSDRMFHWAPSVQV